MNPVDVVPTGPQSGPQPRRAGHPTTRLYDMQTWDALEALPEPVCEVLDELGAERAEWN